MKIGILAFANMNNGGIFQYTHSMVDAIKNDKSNIYVIFCCKNDDRFDNLGLQIRKIELPQKGKLIKIIRLCQLLFYIRKPYFFSKEELEFFEDIDLFLSPTISAYPHFYINKPFVFTLHDMQERYYPYFFTLKERLIRWLNSRILTKSAYRILCESNYVKKDIIKFTNTDSNKIFVIQSPPPEEFLNFTFDGDQFKVVKEKYNLPDKFLFYPAQCWYHKNHIKLIEAFKIINKKYNDLYLVLTGSKQNNYYNLMMKIKDLNLEDKVLHLGYIDYEDLPYLYKMSIMLVMPSLFESVSIPIYEAFSLKVPVCTSNAVALPEQVGDAALLFDPNDIYDMVEKILIYLENKEILEEKAQKGYEKVKDFDHHNYRFQLLKVLE